MKLTVSRDAAQWYIEEMGLEKGDFIQFVVRLYGQSIHPNFSLGIEKQPPRKIGVETNVEGITFYFNEDDLWFLKDHELSVTLDDGEAAFSFRPLTT